jgi:hypothetical protein
LTLIKGRFWRPFFILKNNFLDVHFYLTHTNLLLCYCKAVDDEIFIAAGLTEGGRARLARLAKWYRQIDVASLAGVTVEEVTNVEKDRYVTPERKCRILRVVGLLDEGDENDR